VAVMFDANVDVAGLEANSVWMAALNAVGARALLPVVALTIDACAASAAAAGRVATKVDCTPPLSPLSLRCTPAANRRRDARAPE